MGETIDDSHILENFEDDDRNEGITFSMNQKGGMYLIYQGFPFTKKSSCYNRHYWRCIHQKPLKCKAGIAHILDKNKLDIFQGFTNSSLI